MALTRISFTYPEDMKNQLQTLAEEDNRSLSSYIRILFEKHIKKQGVTQKTETIQKPKVRKIKRRK